MLLKIIITIFPKFESSFSVFLKETKVYRMLLYPSLRNCMDYYGKHENKYGFIIINFSISTEIFHQH